MGFPPHYRVVFPSTGRPCPAAAAFAALFTASLVLRSCALAAFASRRSLAAVTRSSTPSNPAILEAIAQQHLHVPTLETQSADSLDFHNVAVWNLKAALQAAYEEGRRQRRAVTAGENS